jgi:hypothetical protein
MRLPQQRPTLYGRLTADSVGDKKQIENQVGKHSLSPFPQS